MYDVMEISKYIIKKCEKSQIPVNNLKLQKIIYYIQADFLVRKNEPCFPEKIIACDFGPVVHEVLMRYRAYGSGIIPGIAVEPYSTAILKKDQKTIDEIICECAKYSNAALVEITQKQKPWQNAYSKGYGAEIKNEDIRLYFI